MPLSEKFLAFAAVARPPLRKLWCSSIFPSASSDGVKCWVDGGGEGNGGCSRGFGGGGSRPLGGLGEWPLGFYDEMEANEPNIVRFESHA